MKLQREKIYIMFNGLSSMELEGKKFGYVAGRNLEFLDNEVKKSEKYKDPSKEYQEFLDELEKLRVKFAKKDSNDKPVMIQDVFNGRNVQRYDIDDADNVESPFRKALAKLEKQYEKATEDHAKKLESFRDKFMKEDVEIRLIKINYDDIPEKINSTVMKAILPIVDNAPEDMKPV